MANPHKGEVSFQVEGETYILSLSANAYCEIEEVCGIDINALQSMLQNPDTFKLGALRKIFWQALRDNKPEITFEDAKQILRNVTPAEMGTVIGKVFVASMPKEKEAENPPQPDSPPDNSPSGTGPASSSSG